MANYNGPKVKLSRRVGVPISDTPKHTTKRESLTPNGQHGARGRRLRDYGVRLNEKQKLRYHYNVLERQFRGYVDAAGRQEGNAGANLLRLLEQRLDNVVRRLGWGRTIWAARQLVTHGHVQVNGKKVDRPSYQIKVGDVLSLKRENSQTLARAQLDSKAGHEVPAWLESNPGELKAKVLSQPTADQVPFDVNSNLITEFYR